MGQSPDYNESNPSTLLHGGLLKGGPINLDPSTITPLKQHHGMYTARLRWTMSGTLARGAKSDVVAIKRVEENGTRLPRNAQREAHLLADMDHANVLALLNAYLVPPSNTSPVTTVLMFTPCYALTLEDVMNSPSLVCATDSTATTPLPLKVINSLAHQLISAVAYAHSREIAHRDINSRNCVIGPGGHLVLIDFGISIKTGDEPPGQMHFQVGTQPYRAPELIFASKDYDPQALDLWALGATLAEFFTPLTTKSRCKVSPSSLSDDGNSSDFEVRRERYGSEDRDEPNDGDDGVEWSADLQSRRETLFDGSATDFTLSGSIFKLLGTPTVETWPEVAALPSFRYFKFQVFEPQPLASRLPYLPLDPESKSFTPLDKIIRGLLVYSAAGRMRASDALASSSWDDTILLEVDVEGPHDEAGSAGTGSFTKFLSSVMSKMSTYE